MNEHEDDPHIQVAKNVTQAGAAYRVVTTPGRSICAWPTGSRD
jgi:hypothetical protein